MASQEKIESGGKYLTTCIQDSIRTGKAVAIGKLGTSELDVLDAFLQRYKISSFTEKAITVNAGVWPNYQIPLWAKSMRDDVLPFMDVCVEWNRPRIEIPMFDAFCPDSHRIVLRALEPYYQTDPSNMWTLGIPGGTRVAIVSPFSHTIQTQINSGNIYKIHPISIWNQTSPPDFIPIRTGCSPYADNEGPASWSVEIQSHGWKSAVEYIVTEVIRSGAKVAVVGCGGLSLPIVVALKKRGITAIHTGGATQTLFGISGTRWDTHSIISTFYNEFWTRPTLEEKPKNAVLIERACYW